MPRIIPKKRAEPEQLPLPGSAEWPLPTPLPAPLDNYAHLLRARATFKAGGVVFLEGEVHSANSPLVQAIVAEYPQAFENLILFPNPMKADRGRELRFSPYNHSPEERRRGHGLT